ncbi:MAG TPA: branched-chain amino acid ABC transporter permease, partial [Reyranella sp.]
MLRALLSDDLPRSRWLAVLLVAIVVGLAIAPFLFPGAKSLNVAAKICVFIVLAASFDLLLGYTGIVSFAHTMFFGIGAYGVAIALTRLGADWIAVAAGVAAGLLVAIVLAALIGLFSLRVRTIFFAMITLAVASAFAILASQLSDLTGGEDGLNYRLPAALRASFSLGDGALFGVRLN